MEKAKKASASKVEINEKNKKVLVCTYGTLRVGHGNWSRLLDGKSKHLGVYNTEPRFTMYGKGYGFPVVGTDGNTAIEYDLFEVTDDNVLQNLHRLEGCSGIPGHCNNWYDITPIETPHGTAYMYVQHGNVRHGAVIESGNWNNQ